MKRPLAIAIAIALGAATSSADAVMLNPRGTGQVLIYPYYTVNHQQTLVSVVNTTAHGKALKVRFREGYDGREVASFNLYLAPYDTWVGAVYDTSADGLGAAAIATNDDSCTVPAFPLAPVPGTLHALTFSNANYSRGDYGTPTGTDHGPTNLARTREGFFEIIEMGEVVDQASASPKTLEAITPVNGTPPGCAQIRNAWANGGYWTTTATVDLLPPAGGIYGAVGIVDVALGTLYAVDATAIDGFSDVAQHTAPDNSKPNLSTAVTDSAHDLAVAYVPIGNAMVKADYQASTRGVDAVSAVLMADTLSNEFDTEAELGAATDWIVSFPTKQFYVDPGIVGAEPDDALAPFEVTFDVTACNGVSANFYDRQGQLPKFDCGFPECQVLPGNYLCYEAAPITFGVPYVLFGQHDEPSKVLGSMIGTASLAAPFVQDYPSSGHVDLLFPDSAEVTRPALGGQIFFGLPALGFAAINYINANVTPGVLSNYSAAYPHRSTATCVTAAEPSCQ